MNTSYGLVRQNTIKRGVLWTICCTKESKPSPNDLYIDVTLVTHLNPGESVHSDRFLL
jgi:hypothetical protein